MQLLKILPIVLIIFISGCATQVSKTQTQGEQTIPSAEIQPVEEAPTQQPTEQGALEGEVAQQEIPSIPPLPAVKEFTIEADDRAFYIDNKDITSISVSKGNLVKISFKVREAGTYYGGLDFRGCGQDTPDTKPGASADIQFTADSTCTIISYWPASNVLKDTMQVVVS